MFWRNPRKELPMFEQTDKPIDVSKSVQKLMRRKGGVK